MNSTRRFWARPASVLLSEEMGYDKYVSFECGCAGDRRTVLAAGVELLRKQWEET